MLVVNLDKEGDLLVASIEPWNFFFNTPAVSQLI